MLIFSSTTCSFFLLLAPLDLCDSGRVYRLRVAVLASLSVLNGALLFREEWMLVAFWLEYIEFSALLATLFGEAWVSYYFISICWRDSESLLSSLRSEFSYTWTVFLEFFLSYKERLCRLSFEIEGFGLRNSPIPCILSYVVIYFWGRGDFFFELRLNRLIVS